MDAYLDSLTRPKPRRRTAPATTEQMELLAAVEPESQKHPITPKVISAAEPRRSLIEEYVPEAPTDSPVFRELVEIAQDRLLRCGEYGATIGEVVAQYERSGRRVGGVKMEDKVKEQRQTSWLPQVMKAAGGISTKAKRPSPLKRHHHKEQNVYVHRSFASVYEPVTR